VYVYKPFTVFSILIALLILAYIAIGIFIMLTSMLFNKKLSSILFGIFIIILSLIPELQPNQTIIANIIHNNLLVNTHSFNNINSKYNSIGYSISFWILVISFLYWFGYRLSHKKNFI
jgi:disulfide bond formation protein DsbB